MRRGVWTLKLLWAESDWANFADANRLLLWFFRQGGHLRGWSQKIQEDSRLRKHSWGAGLGTSKKHHILQRSWPQIAVWTVFQNVLRLLTALGRILPYFEWGHLFEFPSLNPRLFMRAELRTCLFESWSLDHSGCVSGAAPGELHPCVDLTQDKGPQL